MSANPVAPASCAGAFEPFARPLIESETGYLFCEYGRCEVAIAAFGPGFWFGYPGKRFCSRHNTPDKRHEHKRTRAPD